MLALAKPETLFNTTLAGLGQAISRGTVVYPSFGTPKTSRRAPSDSPGSLGRVGGAGGHGRLHQVIERDTPAPMPASSEASPPGPLVSGEDADNEQPMQSSKAKLYSPSAARSSQSALAKGRFIIAPESVHDQLADGSGRGMPDPIGKPKANVAQP